MSLAENRLHVLANHLQVPGTHVSKISSNDEHLAGEAEREVRLVPEGDTEEERSVLNGMADVVYDLAVDLGIALAKLTRRFRMRLSIFLLSLSVIGVMGVLPTHTIFGFLGPRFLVMALPPDYTLGVRRGLRALAGALFLLLLFLLDALFFVGHC
jgi:hypothetical protein